MVKRQNKKTDDVIKFGIVAGILIISMSIFYYFVIFLPQKEREKTELKREELETIEANRTLLNDCLREAERKSNDFWNKMCRGQGLKEDCSLPQHNADSAKEYLDDWKEECFKKYPVE